MNRYWAEREANTQKKLTDKNIKETNEQLRKYYRSAMKQVISDFENTYNKLLATVVEGKQPTPADIYSLDKYWKMQNQLAEYLQKLGEKEAKFLSKKFMEEYKTIYEAISIKGQVAFTQANLEIAEEIINSVWVADGKSWSTRIWENTNKLREELNENLIHCVIAGKKSTELKHLLQERFGVAFNRADTVVRTELAHIQTQAAKQRYKDYGIKEVEILVDPDERTCPVCGKLDGKRYSINAQMPVPVHPRCRCCIVPVVETKLNK